MAPSHCKTTPAAANEQLRLLKTRIFGLSTQIHFEPEEPSKSCTGKSVSNKKLRFLSAMRPDRKTSISLAVSEVAGKLRPPRTASLSTPKSDFLFQEIAARPSTSYHLSISLLEHDARPNTKARARRSSVVRTE